MTTWRLACPSCDTGYRKMHESVSIRTAAKALDAAPGQLNDDPTYVRCNNCRSVHTVAETRELDIQAGVGR